MPRVISKNKPGGPKTTNKAKNKPKKKGTKKHG